jgi:hypothetical protein
MSSITRRATIHDGSLYADNSSRFAREFHFWRHRSPDRKQTGQTDMSATLAHCDIPELIIPIHACRWIHHPPGTNPGLEYSSDGR